jgi:hypothetical protein
MKNSPSYDIGKIHNLYVTDFNKKNIMKTFNEATENFSS